MTVWNYFTLVGGLAVFLYGMLLMNKYLTAIAGDRLSKIMLNLTRGRVRGYLTGLGVTLINQSSSATTVLESALVGAGLMTFQQSLAVTLGAELGSTFLGQLVAFPSITKLSTVFIAIGFFSSLLTKTRRQKSVARTVLGFGLLFLGMDMMSTSLAPLRTYEPFLNMMASIDRPILGILIGLLFTMIVQSSGATSGLTIAMALSGTITFSQAVPINMGAAIGTCITAVLGSLALNREAKRTAYIHIVFQTIGVIVVYILLLIPVNGGSLWLEFIRWFTATVLRTDSIARQIAMAHTFMSVAGHLLIFPLLSLIVRLYDRVYPPKESEAPFGVQYISDTLIETPDLALKAAKEEMLRALLIVRDMFEKLGEVFEHRDTKIIQVIRGMEDQVDVLRGELIPFLTRLGAGELTDEESVEEVRYLYITNEIESIGDVVDKNILALMEKLIENNYYFSESGAVDVRVFHREVLESLDNIYTVLHQDSTFLAEVLTKSGSRIRRFERDLRERHFSRLQVGLKETESSSSVHLDLLNNFKRINDHIVYIAYTALGRL